MYRAPVSRPSDLPQGPIEPSACPGIDPDVGFGWAVPAPGRLEQTSGRQVVDRYLSSGWFYWPELGHGASADRDHDPFTRTGSTYERREPTPQLADSKAVGRFELARHEAHASDAYVCVHIRAGQPPRPWVTVTSVRTRRTAAAPQGAP